LLKRHALGVVIGVAFVALAGVLAIHDAYIRRDIDRSVADVLASSLDFTRAEIEGWARRRTAQAELLGLAAEQDADVAARVPADRRLTRLFSAVARTEHDAGIAYVPPSGGAPTVTGSITGVRSAAPGITVVSASRTPHIAFTVPVGDSAGRHGRIIIEAVAGPATFTTFDPAAKGTTTGRTSLIVRHGDSILVVATKSNGNGVFPRAFDSNAVPAHVRSALQGVPAHGKGRGITGRDVVFAATPALAPGWALLREQDTREIYARMRSETLMQGALFGTIGVLLILIALGAHRVIRTRRERVLTEMRANFVASASHELRTPLAKVKMFAQLLQNGALRTEADTRHALGVIEKETDRLSILVDNLLSFARLRHSVSDYEVVPCDVAEVTSQVIGDFTALAAERGVSFDVSTQPHLVVQADSTAVRQILINFLENAVKYGPRSQTIRVSTYPSGNYARVQVDDEGEGIPQAERADVWKAFYRRPSAIDSGESGSGLGLAVVRDLVSRVNGRVAVDDSPSGGARFIVDFPMVAPHRLPHPHSLSFARDGES
jgi:signal transduction histidine kinase